MNYLILAYGAMGLVAYLWYAPRYLRQRNIKRAEIGGAAVGILIGDIFGILILLAALAIWPIAVPLWIWMEIDQQKHKQQQAELCAREREAKAHDRYYGLSLDQKLEILAEKVEETRRAGTSERRPQQQTPGSPS